MSGPEGDWRAITPYLPKREADREFEKWQRLELSHGRAIRGDNIRLDIGRGADGRSVFRYSYRQQTDDDPRVSGER